MHMNPSAPDFKAYELERNDAGGIKCETVSTCASQQHCGQQHCVCRLPAAAVSGRNAPQSFGQGRTGSVQRLQRSCDLLNSRQHPPRDDIYRYSWKPRETSCHVANIAAERSGKARWVLKRASTEMSPSLAICLAGRLHKSFMLELHKVPHGAARVKHASCAAFLTRLVDSLSKLTTSATSCELPRRASR